MEKTYIHFLMKQTADYSEMKQVTIHKWAIE